MKNVSDFVLFFFLFIALLLFFFAYQYFLKLTKVKKTKKPTGKAKAPCPLCNSILYGNEQLISRVYKTFDTTDQACTILGCPHCYPVPEFGITRTCPVCKKKVPINGHLDAHLFTRTERKKHVHITGCTECHKKK